MSSLPTSCPWPWPNPRPPPPGLLDLTWDLEVKLPGTRAAFRDGTLRASKARIIADAARTLDPGQARAAEALVLGRAGRLTPGGLRAAIARAVMQVAPEAARKRREEAARDARVERWAEDSGNAALVGRELPPAEVLAADQRITWWAKELRKAGLDGDMDELRARAYLDLLLDKDSRPRQDLRGTAEAAREATAGPARSTAGTHARETPGRPDPGRIRRGPPSPPRWSPCSTWRTGPARSPASAPSTPRWPGTWPDRPPATPGPGWCVTLTDADGHAIGHGCAPQPARPAADPARRQHHPAATIRPARPPEAVDRDSRSTCQRARPARRVRDLATVHRHPRQRDQIISLGPIATDDCDHRHEARGHDPGVRLRHLSEIRHATCTAPACGPPPSATSSTTPRTRRAAGAACVTAVRNAGMIIGSSKTPGGKSSNRRTALPVDHPLGRPTPPNRPGTRSDLGGCGGGSSGVEDLVRSLDDGSPRSSRGS